MYKRTFNFIMMSANSLEIHTQSNFNYLRHVTQNLDVDFLPVLLPFTVSFSIF